MEKAIEVTDTQENSQREKKTRPMGRKIETDRRTSSGSLHRPTEIHFCLQHNTTGGGQSFWALIPYLFQRKEKRNKHILCVFNCTYLHTHKHPRGGGSGPCQGLYLVIQYGLPIVGEKASKPMYKITAPSHAFLFHQTTVVLVF